MTVEVGDVLEQRYKIADWLGRGNQAEVFKASDLANGLDVAIKVLHSDIPLEKLQKQREIESRLNHQNVLRILDIGTSPRAFLVYEYVDGTLLGQIDKPDQKLISSVLSQTLSSLVHIHECGLVHGDVKPSNIIVTADGHAKLLDLSFLDEIDSGDATKEIQGTPAYCSPEQLRGDDLDRSCDLYSWCLTAIECLNGQSVFAGRDTSEIIQAQLSDEDLLIPSALNTSDESRYLRAALSKQAKTRSYEPELLNEWLQVHCDPIQREDRLEQTHLPAASPDTEPELVERAKPLSLLRQSLKKSHNLVLICGKAGTGKTRLLEAALSEESKYTIIDCSSDRIDSTLNSELGDSNQAGTLLALENLSYWHLDAILDRPPREATTIITTSDSSLAAYFPNADVITLEPLSYQAIRKLLKIYSDLDHVVMDRVANLSAGNPAIALLLAEKAERSQATIPEQLSFWLIKRVNQQSRLFRQLQELSLYGVVFPRALIEDERLLSNTQEYIIQRNLNGIPCVEFVEPFVQAAIYATIEIGERELWHKSVLQRLEQSDVLKKSCEILPHSFAPHYEKSGQQRRAFELWYLAGRKYRAAAEHQMAVRYFSKALDSVILGAEIDLSMLQKNLSALIDSVGALYGYSSPEITKTLEILESKPYQDLDGYQELTYRLARFSQGKGDLVKSKLISDVLLQDKSLSTDRRLNRMVSLTHAFTETYLGNFPSALDTLKIFAANQSDIVDLEEHDTVFAAKVLNAWVQFVSGDIDESFELIDNLEQTTPVSHAKHMRQSTSVSMFRLVGEVSMALEIAEELVRATSSGEAPFWQALGLMQKGALLTRLNKKQESLDLLLNGLDRFKALNALHGVTEWQTLAAEALLRVGDYESAQEFLDEATVHIETTGETIYQSQVMMLNAYLLAKFQSRFEDAIALFDEAIVTAQQQEAGLFELNAIYLRANTLSDANDPTPAKYLDLLSDLDRQAIRDYWRIT